MNTIPENSIAPTDLINLDNRNASTGVKIAGQKNGETSSNIISPAKELNVDAKNSDFFSEIRQSLEKINDFIPVNSTSLVFEFDELGDPPIVKVIDKENDEIIREIPPQEFREVAKALESLADKLSNKAGVLFNDSV